MTSFLAERLGCRARRDPLNDLLHELSHVVVGCTEHLDLLLPLVFSAMGLRPSIPDRSNVSGVHFRRRLALTEGLRDSIRASNPHDVMLHAACRRLERTSMARLRAMSAPDRSPQ
jgi:hypothetical protein